MQDPKQLFAVLLAMVLSTSVLSGAIITAPLTPVFAQSNNDDDDGDENDDSSEEESEIESEDEHDDAEKGSEDEKVGEEHDEKSKVELEVKGNAVEIKVEKEDMDLADGIYNATFTCTEPPTTKAFEEAFEVEEGEGDLQVEFQLTNGTYTECEVALDEPKMTLASFEPFIVPANEGTDKETKAGGENDEDRNEESEKRDDRLKEEMEGGETESESKIKLETDDNSIEVEVERSDLDLEDGLYSVTFACSEPEISMNFDDSLEVKDGESEFETEIALDAGTYSGCHVSIEDTDMVLAGFDTFTVGEDSEQRFEVTEKVKEKREKIISKVQEVRKRVAETKQDLPLLFASDLNYTLVATGTTVDEQQQVGMAGVDLTVWKSNPAIVIMAVTGGNVEIGENTYSVEIGYALYSLQHSAFRLSALVVEESSGDIMRLFLRGETSESAVFPDKSGESVGLMFEGSSGPQKNRLAGNELLLEGSLQAT